MVNEIGIKKKKWNNLSNTKFYARRIRLPLKIRSIVKIRCIGDSTRRYSFRHLYVTEGTSRFGVLDWWIFHKLVNFFSVTLRTTSKDIQKPGTGSGGDGRVLIQLFGPLRSRKLQGWLFSKLLKHSTSNTLTQDFVLCVLCSFGLSNLFDI